jgi:hypothetical protein
MACTAHFNDRVRPPVLTILGPHLPTKMAVRMNRPVAASMRRLWPSAGRPTMLKAVAAMLNVLPLTAGVTQLPKSDRQLAAHPGWAHANNVHKPVTGSRNFKGLTGNMMIPFHGGTSVCGTQVPPGRLQPLQRQRTAARHMPRAGR